MAYTKNYPGGWQDYPLETTPITAAALDNIEDGIIGVETALAGFLSKTGGTITGSLVVDGINLPDGANVLTLKKGSATNRFVLETQDSTMRAFLEAGGSIGLMGTITKSDFRIRTDYTDRVTIGGTTGFMGILNTSPTQALDVSGRIRMRTQTSTDDDADIVASKGYVDTGLLAKQDTIVSGTNIKTINDTSLLGSGDISIDELPTISAYSVLVNKTANSAKPESSIEYSSIASDDTLAIRRSSGRLKVGTPTDNDDAATKLYVDDIVGDIESLLEAI